MRLLELIEADEPKIPFQGEFSSRLRKPAVTAPPAAPEPDPVKATGFPLDDRHIVLIHGKPWMFNGQPKIFYSRAKAQKAVDTFLAKYPNRRAEVVRY